MENIHCLRCTHDAPPISEKNPYPGPLGQMILQHICQECWAAWKKFSVNVINDYKLRPYLPADRAVVEKHMKQFLNFELQGLSSITLSGQEKNVTFDTPPLKQKVLDMLEQIYDPEVPVNIYDLGLIYDVALSGTKVDIKMTLTSAHCPAAKSLPATVKEAVARVAGVSEVSVEVVWDPPWTRERVSEEGKKILGM